MSGIRKGLGFADRPEHAKTEATEAFERELDAELDGDNRVAERLRGVAADMRGIGASSMSPRELFAYWAGEVDKAADLADFIGGENRIRQSALGGGECELAETATLEGVTAHVLECSACGHTCEHVNGTYPRCPHCGRKAVER